MKWKGRRQSDNVEDERNSDPIAVLIQNDDKYNGGASPVNKNIPKDDGNWSFDPNDKKEMEVVKELGKIHREKRTPVPTPRPKITKTQVTPGKWVTK